MFTMLGIQVHTISSSILYIILILVLIKSWMILMDEQTAFEETVVENERKLPSFTLCPYGANKSIESFEDVAAEVKDFESKILIQYSDYDPSFETAQDRRKIEKYNDTLNSTWYFVPKISIRNPSETTICLIWTPSTELKLKLKIQVHNNLF